MYPQNRTGRAESKQTPDEKLVADTLIAQAQRAGLSEVLDVHVHSHYGVNVYELSGQQLSLVEQTFSYLYDKIYPLPNQALEH